jgi:murein DD-endopeptidase MepM/ murein hydrolase activator NlpD
MTRLLLRGLTGLALLAATLSPASAVEVPLPTASQAQAGAPAAERIFWVKDKHHYRSPWYAGKHRKMINFGCTPAPYYDPDPRCRRERGYHHGLDIHMACGTRLFAGFTGVVVNPRSRGALGPAYGRRAFRIRNHRKDVDVVIGHPGRVYVSPGERVRRRDLIARASDDGAPDGCHLHFETRPIGGSYTDAFRPHPYLDLRRAD